MKRYILPLLLFVSCALYAQDAIHISASELYAAYSANEVAADRKYKGKSVVVRGRIQRIGKEILGHPYVVIGGSGMLDGVQCVFAEAYARSGPDEYRLSLLSKGQSVTISGTCSGSIAGLVLVTDCAL